MAKKHSVHLTSIFMKVFCSKLGKEITVHGDDIIWSAIVQDCETCGDHGHVAAGFQCECGMWHEIILKDW